MGMAAAPHLRSGLYDDCHNIMMAIIGGGAGQLATVAVKMTVNKGRR
jgi:hypothetical protein